MIYPDGRNFQAENISKSICSSTILDQHYSSTKLVAIGQAFHLHMTEAKEIVDVFMALHT